jgi:hypothetical protein
LADYLWRWPIMACDKLKAVSKLKQPNDEENAAPDEVTGRKEAWRNSLKNERQTDVESKTARCGVTS